MQRIDAAILGKVEQFCHWWQRLTGLTNLWWAKIGALMYLTEVLMEIGNHFWKFLPYTSSLSEALWSASTIPLALFMVRWTIRQEGVTRTQGDVKPSWRLWMRFPLAQLLRITLFVSAEFVLFLMVIVLGLGVFLMSLGGSPSFGKGDLFLRTVYIIMMQGPSFFLYLIDVDPLPPAESKIGQWADDIRAWLKKSVPVPTQQ